MSGHIKPIYAAVFAITVLVCVAWTTAPQDPQRRDPFQQQSVWNFAILQYTDSKGDVVEVPARDIARIHLLATVEDRLRMEIVYQNRDYSSIAIRDFSVIRTSPTVTASDVPVMRGRFETMAFPGFRE